MTSIVDVFARGDQELFHSAFIAWLLDSEAPHGFGTSVQRGLLSPHADRLGYDSNISYVISTEVTRGKKIRHDIELCPPAAPESPIVLENKFKSRGRRSQLDKYAAQGVPVAALEFLDSPGDSVGGTYPRISYGQLLNVLDGLPLEESNHHHFLIGQYIDSVRTRLTAFSSLDDLVAGLVTPDVWSEQMAALVLPRPIDNDIRSFVYHYYLVLGAFLESHHPELVFGDLDYKEFDLLKDDGKLGNTGWIAEKDMPGPPYIETLIGDPSKAGWQYEPRIQAVYDKTPFTLAPRIEARFYPGDALSADKPVGKLMLGAWNPDFQEFVRKTEPYKSRISPRPRSRRNFHCDEVTVADLQGDIMAEKIRSAVDKLMSST